MKPTIVIIGAGSVEFTRELLGDILSFDELASVRIVLHDMMPSGSETAEAIAGEAARAAGADPEVIASTDRRRASTAPTASSTSSGRHARATVRDFETPARYGLNQTIE